jgi:hypothetical protein
MRARKMLVAFSALLASITTLFYVTSQSHAVDYTGAYCTQLPGCSTPCTVVYLDNPPWINYYMIVPVQYTGCKWDDSQPTLTCDEDTDYLDQVQCGTFESWDECPGSPTIPGSPGPTMTYSEPYTAFPCTANP